jgi:hypothetical protein
MVSLTCPFTLTKPLEACAWHPEGKFFITGYEVAPDSSVSSQR